jgi:hypothetical protein
MAWEGIIMGADWKALSARGFFFMIFNLDNTRVEFAVDGRRGG